MGNFKIREFRKAMNIFQGEMAEVVGLTQSNLSRYENNGIDLNIEQLNKLRERYGKETVDAYMTDSSEQIRDKSIPESQAENLAMLDLISIIKKQNETLGQQMETLGQLAKQVTSLNERLMCLLEKVSFE